MPAKQQFVLHKDEVYERRHIHSFTMSDVEDPEIYVAQPIWEWQQTEKGKWVMEHGLEPTFSIITEPITYGYRVVIHAHITPKRWTEFCLRFS